MRMILRLLLSILLACALIACASPQAKKDQADAKAKAKAKAEAEDLEDDANDPDFLAFLGRLRKAVAQHDVQTLAPMMTTNFGYCLNPVGEGPGVFQYWDQQNIWPQLQAVLGQHFLPKGNFMVAPPAFATDPAFHGYRAGLTTVDGSWRFAYFVTD
jgi:hypothetical protein